MPPIAHKSLLLPGLVLLNLAILSCPACTFVGLGLGTMNPRYREVDIRKIEDISPGSQIHVSIYPKRHLISSNESKSNLREIEEITGIFRGTVSTVDIDARVKIVAAMLEEIRTQQSPEDSIRKAKQLEVLLYQREYDLLRFPYDNQRPQRRRMITGSSRLGTVGLVLRKNPFECPAWKGGDD
jgi:hypothetical protein